MTRTRKSLPSAPVETEIIAFSHDGRGLAQVDGKIVFVRGALVGERVRFRYTKSQRRYDEGEVVEIVRAAPDRVTPRCAHFGQCGGCALQHLASAAQITVKQTLLAEALQRIGKVAPAHWLPPVTDQPWGYRRKARLGVREVPRKGRVLVGFRERASSWVADLQHCPVLTPHVGERLAELAALLDRLSVRKQVAQLELAQGDGPAVLVLRLLAPLCAADQTLLLDYAAHSGVHFYIQDGGLDSVRPLPGQAVELFYDLPKHDLRIMFAPTDFTQINLGLNRRLVDLVLELLALQGDERILDLFCGLGNFTLPIARRAATVLGIEGAAGLVNRARANAARHGLSNVQFRCADLYADAVNHAAFWGDEPFDKAVLDPPRSGAFQVLDSLAQHGIQRIVYISCYPATLARDAERLVHTLGYRLWAAAALDMFPHTAHVEAVALFVRD